MVFSSQLFLFYFLPLVLALYYAVRLGPRWLSHGALIALSYLFYGWANPPFMLVMLASTSIDFVCGLVIARAAGRGRPASAEPALCEVGGPRTRSQKLAVTVSICSNLLFLGFFKYWNFSLESYNVLVDALGLSHLAWREFLRVTLPLGISFYTFQSMSYTIDVYRGHARATRNPFDFACYVSLFPQLVAGPIVRFSEVSQQLIHRTHSAEKFARGVAMFSLGLAKKVMLANPCGKIADTCFDAGSIGALDAWWGAVAYAFQIYFDFSGYSDMAIGLGLMLGFVFPKNFDSPYWSRSITEFWQRWHISLSSWLRDYLYIPLGGNRRGPRRTYLNLAIVMLLGGLWHGAALKFIVWGGIHGAWLAFERALGKRSLYHRLPTPLRIAITFLIVTLAWVFFRARDLPAAVAYLSSMFALGAVQDGADLVAGLIYQPYYVINMLAAAAVVWLGRQSWDWTRTLRTPQVLVCLLLLWLSSGMLFAQAHNPFIYFIF
jgi:alginate O-acetyltransferase complex protein AlgI